MPEAFRSDCWPWVAPLEVEAESEALGIGLQTMPAIGPPILYYKISDRTL